MSSLEQVGTQGYLLHGGRFVPLVRVQGVFRRTQKDHWKASTYSTVLCTILKEELLASKRLTCWYLAEGYHAGIVRLYITNILCLIRSGKLLQLGSTDSN